MLNLGKQVLLAVYSYPQLFQKEYLKIIKWLPESELNEFKDWCASNFDSQFLSFLYLN